MQAVDDWAGSSPLHWAAFAATGTACVRLLIAEKAQVEVTNARDASCPLHLAARYGRTETAKVLVTEGGANVDAANNLGNTPLHEGSFQGHAETADALCVHHADLECVNNKGLTPLLAAAQAGHSSRPVAPGL